MHPQTKQDLEFLLTYVKDHGLDATVEYIRKNILKNKK